MKKISAGVILALGSVLGIPVADADDDFKLNMGGRIQADYATYFNNSLMGPAGAKLRRARLFAEGSIAHDWKYKFQYEFTGTGAAGFADAYFAYTGLSNTAITLGQSKTFFSMDQLNSSNDNVFMERPLLEGLDAYGNRRMGLKLTTHGANWMLGLGGFANALNENLYTTYTPTTGAFRTGVTSTPTNQSGIYTISGRATFAPLYAKGNVLYFGTNLNYTGFGENSAASAFSTSPETSVTGRKLLSVYVSRPSSQFEYEVETAVVAGPLAMEAAYVGLEASRRGGLPSAHFDGYYVQASYTLTGQPRNFQPSVGEFHYLKDIGRGGAWEAALRYDALNLNDAKAGIYGGRGYNVSAGLNWYANKHVRLMLEYSYAHIDSIPVTLPVGQSYTNNPINNGNVNILQARGQFLF
ncbi:MAG: OprO/OprP family phosphate-selective porin [Gammaproteobacteria bacterium]|nr:OprO/OprP family phosphate-selective porin [Gammaproteobacteria bacterium]